MDFGKLARIFVTGALIVSAFVLGFSLGVHVTAKEACMQIAMDTSVCR